MNEKEIEWTVADNGCWNCISHSPDTNGYPQITRDGKKWKMSRWVVQEQLGISIKSGIVVRHICNNPQCINAEHLTLGTVQDNCIDRLRRRPKITSLPPTRHRISPLRGGNHPSARLTDAQAAEVRALREQGKSYGQIACRFGVPRMLVYNVVRGLTYKPSSG
jgi:DNA-binding CsgD family transcriptional regulator